jgi:hypothetical protein
MSMVFSYFQLHKNDKILKNNSSFEIYNIHYTQIQANMYLALASPAFPSNPCEDTELRWHEPLNRARGDKRVETGQGFDAHGQ